MLKFKKMWDTSLLAHLESAYLLFEGVQRIWECSGSIMIIRWPISYFLLSEMSLSKLSQHIATSK